VVVGRVVVGEQPLGRSVVLVVEQVVDVVAEDQLKNLEVGISERRGRKVIVIHGKKKFCRENWRA
jgi:hypothetical protein